MLNKMILIAALLMSTKAFSQDFIFDTGSGSRESLRKGVRAINLIQQDKVHELLKLMPRQSSHDSSVIAVNAADVSEKYMYDSIGLPAAFTKKSDNDFFYERNFCTQKDNVSSIVLQIHLTLTKTGNTFQVNGIEFRQGRAIVQRQKEIDRLNNTDPDNPPPPPTP